MRNLSSLRALSAALIAGLASQSATAAIALDRTRAVFNGADKSMSLNITNQNKALPYLAQAWVEDEKGNKIAGPVTALPPLQRIEPQAKGQVKLQLMSDSSGLPQDRESLFYFNLREIPPKSSKANTLQIALQTRIKLFYRPAALQPDRPDLVDAWPQKLTLNREGDKYRVNNPTPYYVTLAGAYARPDGAPIDGFDPVMIAPRSDAMLTVKASELGQKPVLTWINDYGGRPKLMFSCASNVCRVVGSKAG
jgi:P pilus assembly chaperone PapD